MLPGRNVSSPPSSSSPPLLRNRVCLVCLAALICASVWWIGRTTQVTEGILQRTSNAATQQWAFRTTKSIEEEPRTLVIYAYYENGDAAVRGNLEFFLKAGVSEASDSSVGTVDTLIVLNGPCSLPIPALPNLQVIHREANVCFDIGAYKQGIEAIGETIAQYDYIIFINSSVRGPFIPVYLRNSGYHWSRSLTSLLSADVKWVGSTINCAGHPHVQTPVVATDLTGLRVLEAAGIFGCPADFPEAIRKWEIGSSAAIMQANYNIASLQSRYRGIDFRRGQHQGCNGHMNPASFFSNDGLDLDPFEVVFVKSKSTIQVPLADFTRRYSDYMLGRDDLTSNEFHSPRVQTALKAALDRERSEAARCGLIFDEQFYVDSNKDLKFMAVGAGTLTAHFIQHGFGERRPYRFVKDTNKNNNEIPTDC